ncbi:hypothetical protein PTKIN_Ptkin14bG0060500 [Pterospermum kingtungense]
MIYSVSFNITHFDSNITNMEYSGDARPSHGAVKLSMNCQEQVYSKGQVIYTKPVRLQDFGTKQLADFTTHFSFIIETSGQKNYGDGIVFFIVPVGFQSPENSGGGGLGLFPNYSLLSDVLKEKHQIVMVEFDSYANSYQWDPPYEHAGININSPKSSVHTPWNASFHSGDTAHVWISYNASSKNLSVSWSYQATTNPRENSTLSFHVDLREVLPMDRVKVGIGAAIGVYGEIHTLKSWQFSSSLDSKETKGSKTDKTRMIVLLCFGALIVGPVLTYFIIWGRNRFRNKHNIDSEGITMLWIIHDLERSAPRRFSYKDLVLATNNFSDERKLGQGGFGAVYKGHLTESNTDVAVKKFTRSSKHGRKDYIAEVTIVSRLRHRNLVQLIGWCHDQGQFLLVYEFMPNGSLDCHLFSHNCTLTWDTRYKICLGLATAMFYLHNDWEQCVVHRDIKTGNVLLDSNFNVKLGDFGLARLIDHEAGTPRTTCLAGTLGYMSPEYIISGKASSKSDVFSFGVVTLELVTGKRARDPKNYEKGLIEWVWDLYGQGKPLATVDERLQMKFDEQEAKCMVMVGLWCAHPDYTLRASIRQAIQVLNLEAEVPSLPFQMPVPMYQVPPASPPDQSLAESLISNSFLETGR